MGLIMFKRGIKMKLFTAMKMFGVIDNQMTRGEVKEIYRNLARENHPDKGGDDEKMKLINEAYETIQEQYSFVNIGRKFEEDENFWNIDDPEMEEAYKSISHLEGIEIEICGLWMWVTGETYKVKEQLKEAGLFYASRKMAWGWKPKNSTSKSRGRTSLNNIRSKYGSSTLPTSRRHKLS